MDLPIAEALRLSAKARVSRLGRLCHVGWAICGRRLAAREMSGSGLNGGEGGIPFHLYDTENTSLFALFVTQFVTQLQLRFITALSSQLLGSPAQSIRSVETDGL